VSAAGSDEGVRDLAAFWVLTGQAAAKARELELLAARDNRKAAVQAVYLRRGSGDLAAARRLAEKVGDVDLLAGILEEMEDWGTLARKLPKSIQDSPARLATVLYHAGEHDDFEAALKRIPPTETWQRINALIINGRPRQAIDLHKTQNPSTACQLLALQGRRAEALALPDDKVVREQRSYLHIEQARVHHRVGDRAKAVKLLTQALEETDKLTPHFDYVLGEGLRAGVRMNRRQQTLEAIGKILDRLKPSTTPTSFLSSLSPADGDILVLWWNYLHRKYPDALPSATLARLRGWFEDGKPDRDFDALVREVERSTSLPGDEVPRWPAALARTCVAVGKLKKAEEVLRTAAGSAKTAAAYRQLGDFYLERKRWSEAAAEYGRALQRDRSDFLALYLRGVALSKAGQVKEGAALVERARLLPLADETARYYLARDLSSRGLSDEANAVRLVMVRTAPFRSVYSTNAASSLAWQAVRQKRYLDAARYYRRMYLGDGAFMDSRNYLQMPGWALFNQARALLAEGKLDAALVECKRGLEYLPEETAPVIELVRALERAKRQGDADKLFDSVFAPHQKACADFPRSADCHNRLAWLLVRCGRKLDQALQHARTATTLEPQSPGYLDTLAEIHFQRGDRAEAIALMKRVLKLAPGQPYFTAQLRRIEAGNRGADLPEE
jgi:tetratricopeptide (TPR) repeat protein